MTIAMNPERRRKTERTAHRGRVAGTRTVTALMELAVDDIERTTADGRIGAFMRDYGVRSRSGAGDEGWCSVCMAGAVMLQSGVDPGWPGTPLEQGLIDEGLAARFQAVNICRSGNIVEAMLHIGIKLKPLGAEPMLKTVAAQGILRQSENLFAPMNRRMQPEEVKAACAWWRNTALPAIAEAEAELRA